MQGHLSYSLDQQSFERRRYYILLFLIWPFLALISALTDYRSKDAKRVVYMFLIYFGFSFFVGDTGMDSVRYALAFQYNATLPFSDFIDIVSGLYSDTSIDIVEPFVSFVLSRFTDDYRFLFAAYAALFGYFYLKSIDLLHDRYYSKPAINALIVLIFLASALSIHNINGIRMWTAAWVFFYAGCQVILNHDKRFLILALFSSLIHWSFITANAVLLIYVLVGNRNWVYVPLALISFIQPNLLSSIFGKLSLIMGGSIQHRYSGYTNEAYLASVQEHMQRTSWFVTASRDLIFYFLIISTGFIFFFRRKKMNGFDEKSMLSFVILFLAFVNFGKVIPAFGGRFTVVFILFATTYLFLYMVKCSQQKVEWLTILGLFPMLLYAAFDFRIGSEVINSWIFLPGMGLPFFMKGIPLSEILFS